MIDLDRPRHRLLALAVLLGLLSGSLVAAGTLAPDPTANHYPDEQDLGREYAAYQGEKVELDGTVVETDPVVIEADYAPDRTVALTIRSVDEPVAVGQRLGVFGIARPDHTIEARETVVVSRWETYYAWVVSLLAGLWVLARFVHGWRFDRSTVSFEPRGTRDG